MIGGKLIEIAQAYDADAEIRLWCVGTGCEQGLECAVYAINDRGVRLPKIGEEIWWQSGRIYYGGPDPKRGEVSLKKVGASHDPRKP